jgi:hypothetical protein
MRVDTNGAGGWVGGTVDVKLLPVMFAVLFAGRDADARQHLGDFFLKFLADFPARILLRNQHPVPR